MSPASAWVGRANLWSSHLSYSVLSWAHLCSPPDLLFHLWILLGCGCRSAVDRVIFIACIQDLTFHTRQYQKVKILLALVFSFCLSILYTTPLLFLIHFYFHYICGILRFFSCCIRRASLRESCIFQLCFLQLLFWMRKAGQTLQEVSGRYWSSSKAIDLLQKPRGIVR